MSSTRGVYIATYIHENGPLSSDEVVAQLEPDPHNIPRTTIFQSLTTLTKKGVIERSGTRRHYVYTCISPPPPKQTKKEKQDAKAQ